MLPCGLCPNCVEKAPRSPTLGKVLYQPVPAPGVPVDWHETLQEEADAVFTTLAGPDGALAKEELVAASGGDFKLFERMEGDNDGLVSRVEWHCFLKRSYEDKKASKGAAAGADRWLRTMLASVARGQPSSQ